MPKNRTVIILQSIVIPARACPVLRYGAGIHFLFISFTIYFFLLNFSHAKDRGSDEQVFLTEEGALKQAFPDSDRVVKETHLFSKEEKERMDSRLGWVIPESSVTVYQGFRKDQPRGKAVIACEIGKSKPITFIVKVSEEGKVEGVEVMVYRESIGSEVKNGRFAGQFKGKSVKDPLRINRDILNITGATLSAQAVTAGVKKALVMLDEIYRKK